MYNVSTLSEHILCTVWVPGLSISGVQCEYLAWAYLVYSVSTWPEHIWCTVWVPGLSVSGVQCEYLAWAYLVYSAPINGSDGASRTYSGRSILHLTHFWKLKSSKLNFTNSKLACNGGTALFANWKLSLVETRRPVDISDAHLPLFQSISQVKSLRAPFFICKDEVLCKCKSRVRECLEIFVPCFTSIRSMEESLDSSQHTITETLPAYYSIRHLLTMTGSPH